MSSFEFSLFTVLCHSKNETLAAISAKAVKELRYHMTHARDWCYRLGKGTTLSHEKLQNAFQEVDQEQKIRTMIATHNLHAGSSENEINEMIHSFRQQEVLA